MRLLSRLEKKKEEKRRTGTIQRALLSEAEFLVLEKTIDAWNATLSSYIEQEVVAKLYRNSDYNLENLSKDIGHLRSRGLVYYDKKHLLPTFQGVLLYQKAHPKQLVRAACELPDARSLAF